MNSVRIFVLYPSIHPNQFKLHSLSDQDNIPLIPVNFLNIQQGMIFFVKSRNLYDNPKGVM